MNPYSIPFFCAFPLLIVLGLAVILQNPREKRSILLFLFYINTAFLSITAAMLHQSTSETEANFWNKFPYIFALPSLSILTEYSLQVSGSLKRIKEKLLFIPINIQRWAAHLSIAFWWIILIFSDKIIAPARYYSPTGWEHQYGTLFFLLPITGSYLPIFWAAMLLRGINFAPNAIEKRFRTSTLFVLMLYALTLYLPGTFIPWLFELQTHSLAAIGFVPMCVLLTYSYMRSQWETIEDLNIDLEEKIKTRTQELSLTNKKLKNAQNQISKYIDPKIAQKIFEGDFVAELSYRRIKLTMFFSDIKDFTQFTDSSDPEDVAKLLNEYLGEMAKIVRSWGGTISQFAGDGIYAFFGAPDSQGEGRDAISCVRMAIEMQGKMAKLREKWWNQGIQLPFEIRCGIHTGMANVGNYGSEGFMEYSAIGLNTNLASRLEQICEPGEIYLSHATWALIKDEIACKAIGTVEVKGFHYPIQTYKVIVKK